MKNTPITARVKSGMFKTKEPLLNVGPAGVDGNNTTRTMPSPSKMKGYTMKASPFKQTNAEKNVDEATETEAKRIFDGKGGAGGQIETTTIEPGREGTPDTVTKGNSGSDAFKSAFGDARKSGAGTFEFNGKSYSTELSKDPDFGKDKVVKGDPGTDDKVVKTKVKGDTFRKQEGEASTAYATRNNLRKAKVAARNSKKYQRKQDKADRKNGKTELSAKEQRRARKETAAASMKKVADSEMLNAQTQSAQGKSGFGKGKTRLTDVVETAADADTATQLAGLTDSATPPKKTGLFDQFKSPAPMKNKGFFKKKSPIKMNYFKK